MAETAFFPVSALTSEDVLQAGDDYPYCVACTSHETCRKQGCQRTTGGVVEEEPTLESHLFDVEVPQVDHAELELTDGELLQLLAGSAALTGY